MAHSLGSRLYPGLLPGTVTPASRVAGDAAVTVPGDPVRAMGTSRPAAMCVITVGDGPGGVRWALVAVNSDLSRDPSTAMRTRLRSPTEVLAVVAQFLAEAGLDGHLVT